MNVKVQYYSEIHWSDTNLLDSVQNPSTYAEHFIEHINYYMYHLLWNLEKKLSLLPLQCIGMFCMICRIKTDYFPEQH
jgi:hypothetical protein